MKMHELAPGKGATRQAKRLGRGIGSGLGKTSGKGHKGQWARSGGGVRPGFEGGQMPLIRKSPKRGFNNVVFKKVYAIVNIRQLEVYKNGTEVTFELLQKDGIIGKGKDFYGLKVLGDGKIEKKLVVKAHKFSESAAKAITEAGGKIEVIQ